VGALIRLSLDVETWPIRPGRQAPRVVCVQTKDPSGARVELRDAGLDRLEAALLDPQVLLVGHEIAFEALTTSATRPRLLPLWFAAYAADRVTCTHERERLLRIAQGTLKRYGSNTLLEVTERYKIPHAFQAGDKDGGGPRVEYWRVDGVPVEQWPADFQRYAFADLVVDRVYEEQEALGRTRGWLVDEFRQARGALWLKLTSAWGMRTAAQSVEAFARKVEQEYGYARALLASGDPDALEWFCREHDLVDPETDEPWAPVIPYEGGLVRPVGTKDTKAAAARMREVCKVRGLQVPMTTTGKEKAQEAGIEKGSPAWAALAEQYTCLDVDACKGTGDPILIAYARFGSIGTLRSRAERLALAARAGIPVQPRFNTIVETGRTSCSSGDMKPGRAVLAYGDQTQNLHRAPGLRECYVARPGCLILSSDWKAAELHTLAQTCLDLGLDSNMARILNSGRDIHTWFGGNMDGREYEWMIAALRGDFGPAVKKRAHKVLRQGAKAANFGFPGGLGIEKFRAFAAKTYGVLWTEAEARERKGLWLDSFPEMRGYFAHISNLIDAGSPLVHFQSRRVRGRITYPSAANSYFQGRAADMLKDAGFRIARMAYCEGFPARIWNEAHDEILIEMPESIAHEVAGEVVRVMEDVGRDWCPGVPVKAEPALQRIWRKGAEPTYDPTTGRLIPWEDRPIPDETLDKIKKALALGADPVHVSWDYGFSEERIREAA
jgi:hypothetical protein